MRTTKALEVGKVYRLISQRLGGLRYDLLYADGDFIDVRVLSGPNDHGIYKTTTRGEDGEHLGPGGGWTGESIIHVHAGQVEEIET